MPPLIIVCGLLRGNKSTLDDVTFDESVCFAKTPIFSNTYEETNAVRGGDHSEEDTTDSSKEQSGDSETPDTETVKNINTLLDETEKSDEKSSNEKVTEQYPDEVNERGNHHLGTEIIVYWKQMQSTH